MSRIEQIIGEIEEYIDKCSFQPLSKTKIIVNKEELDELLVELRLRIPDEIKKYQKKQSTAVLNTFLALKFHVTKFRVTVQILPERLQFRFFSSIYHSSEYTRGFCRSLFIIIENFSGKVNGFFRLDLDFQYYKAENL